MHWTKFKAYRHIYDQLKYLGLFMIIMYIKILWHNEIMREENSISRMHKRKWARCPANSLGISADQY